MKRRNKFPRPGYVTVICSILIAYAAYGFVVLGVMLLNGKVIDPMADHVSPVLEGIYVAAQLCMMTFGLAMLKGKNWARIFYYVMCTPLLLVMFIILSTKDIVYLPIAVPGMVFLLGFCIALSMERANWFFAGRPTFFPKEEGGSGSGYGGSSHRAAGKFEY